MFRERGLTATLNDVAAHAGVGVGTVYRRFANKEELVDALFDDMIDTVASLAQQALADPDAWHGLTTSLEKVCEVQAFDRGLREVMLGTGRARSGRPRSGSGSRLRWTSWWPGRRSRGCCGPMSPAWTCP